jgi:hypothetical protein
MNWKINSYKGIEDIPNDTSLAIIGTDADNANEWRKSLMRLAPRYHKIKIADMGNYDSLADVQTLLQQLFSRNILPIIVGKNEDLLPVLSETQYLAESPSVFFLDNRINMTNTERLGHSAFVGYQSYFVEDRTFKDLDRRGYEYYRLGEIRASLNNVEPLLRDVFAVWVNASVIRASDAPNTLYPSPAGLYAEEFCRVLRYAGLNERSKCLYIYGWAASENDITTMLMAQAAWYFIEGVVHRIPDHPYFKENFVKYVIFWRKENIELCFWKSKITERWWWELPDRKQNSTHPRFIPCTYTDYLSTTNDDMPERLWEWWLKYV